MTVFGKHIENAAGFCKLLIIAATIIWGLGFVVMKDAVDVIPPAWLLGIRFSITGLILGVILFKRMRAYFNKEHVLFGCVLGVMLFVSFWVQTIGLVYTTPGKNAFLTASYVVFVPFICWLVFRKRPTLFNILAALLCIAGMGLVSLQDSMTVGFGDIITIIGAVLLGVHIVFVSKWSGGRDMLVLTVYQFLAAGICGIIAGACFETLPPVEALLEPSFLLNMAYLIVFGSCLALVFQNIALVHVPPAQASLFLSLEAVFGVLFSVVLYGEALNLRLIAGFALIFVAIVVSETFPLKEAPWRKKRMASMKDSTPIPEATLHQQETTLSS